MLLHHCLHPPWEFSLYWRSESGWWPYSTRGLEGGNMWVVTIQYQRTRRDVCGCWPYSTRGLERECMWVVISDIGKSICALRNPCILLISSANSHLPHLYVITFKQKFNIIIFIFIFKVTFIFEVLLMFWVFFIFRVVFILGSGSILRLSPFFGPSSF